MNLFIITHRIPYPLSEGGKVSQFAMIDYLRNQCTITLLVFVETAVDHEAIHNLKGKWQNVGFEIVDCRKREPAPILSVRQRILTFFSRNIAHVKYRIDKMITGDAVDSKLSGQELQDHKLLYLASFANPRSREVIEQIASALEKHHPDLVQIDFIESMDLAFCIPNEIKKVFVHHEPRLKRMEAEVSLAAAADQPFENYLLRYCDISEPTMLRNFDAIVTFNEEDKSLLLKKLPGMNIVSSPFPVMDSEIKDSDNIEGGIHKLVFVGAGIHSPNRDAVEWYVDNMAEMILRRYGLVLHVVGDWNEEAKRRYVNTEGVCFPGYVEDLAAYCQNSIMIVPVNIGGGLRTKILYAMAWGVPVIATTAASEGIVDKENVTVQANTTSEFVEAIDRISRDNVFRHALVARAQMVVKEHYSQKQAGRKRLTFYQSLVDKKVNASRYSKSIRY